MQLFHTAGVPPSKGKSNFPNSGCNTNINNALENNVLANNIIKKLERFWNVSMSDNEGNYLKDNWYFPPAPLRPFVHEPKVQVGTQSFNRASYRSKYARHN